MVLIRFVVVALVAALGAGCGKSLFDNGTGGDDTPGGDGGVDSRIDGPPVQTSCTAPCLGDASGDFDGSDRGSNGKWRYLDDNRRHVWTPMTGTTTKMGAGMNKIAKCDTGSSAAACTALPGALLVSSTGATSLQDPAIELTLADTKVVQLSLRVHVPAGGKAQVVRLYRSAREDVLFTGTAEVGTTLETSVVIDAFPGERILFALAPTAGGQTDVAVQLFASDTEEVFPKFCQIGLDFEPASAIGNSLTNKCAGTPLTTWNDSGPSDVMTPPTFAAGPFAESGMAADFVEGTHFDSMVSVDRSMDNTTQFWFKLDQFGVQATILVSDMDLDDLSPGGLVIDLFDNAGTPAIEVGTCTDGMVPVQYNLVNHAFTDHLSWHFMRVVQSGSIVKVCVDGAKLFEVPIPAGSNPSSYPIRLGRNSIWNPQAAYVDGRMDDLRIFKAALPCE